METNEKYRSSEINRLKNRIYIQKQKEIFAFLIAKKRILWNFVELLVQFLQKRGFSFNFERKLEVV